MRPYNIVGRQIEFGNAWYLHGQDANGDDIITKDVENNGVQGEPLTVEFIGRTMVALSSNPVRPGDPDYARIVRRIKHCMIVRSLVDGDISDDDLGALWNDLEIELEYDTRTPRPGNVDFNKRIFVVPAQDALKDKADTFTGAAGLGFRPPLTYSLDRNIMANFFASAIDQAIERVANGNEAATIGDIKDVLKDEIKDSLSVTQGVGSSSTPLNAKKNDILTKPAAAFYRAVGVYITQMCD